MASETTAYIETINLTLHVGRAIADGRYKGYHPVDSLVVFAGAADRLAYSLCNEKLSLNLTGLFGKNLSSEPNNLVLRAAQAFYDRAKLPVMGKFRLEKVLPLASGIGGGSADAAAALRLLYWEHCEQPNPAIKANLTDADMMELAESIGADVPVCYRSQTCNMLGIGEILEPNPGLGRIPALLVNPGIAVSTPEIFKAFDAGVHALTPSAQLAEGDLLSRALAGRNDLQDVAISLRPEIGDLIDFALFETFEQAVAGRNMISSETPSFWCRATLFGDAP